MNQASKPNQGHDQNPVAPANPLNKPISEQSANDLLLRSRNDREISQLGELARSLLFAELSMIAYLDEKQANRAARRLNFTHVDFYEQDGSQAYSFINETDHVIACRGTEASEWNDVRADLDAKTALAETIGRVHRGFKKEVDDIWPVLEKALIGNRRKLWFTGHSLGGAMATICAGRCLLSHISSNPEQIYTYGSPRVGNKRYINYTRLEHLRWVNNNDIVPSVPPTWFGYRHTGREMYLNAYGQLRKLTPIQRGKDRWRGFLQGLKKGRFDHFTDHYIDHYVDFIYREAESANEL